MGTAMDDAMKASERIATALSSSGSVADFNSASLRQIDRFFDEQAQGGTAKPGGLLSEDLGSRLFAIGAYVGEDIAMQAGRPSGSRSCCTIGRRPRSPWTGVRLRYNLPGMRAGLRFGPARFFFCSSEGFEPPHVHVERAGRGQDLARPGILGIGEPTQRTSASSARAGSGRTSSEIPRGMA
jgi:hypothetical protein